MALGASSVAPFHRGGNRGTEKRNHWLGGRGAESTKQIICCQAGPVTNSDSLPPYPATSGHEGPLPPPPQPPSPPPSPGTLLPAISTGSLGVGGQLCRRWRSDLGHVCVSLGICFPLFPARSRISVSPRALGASSAARVLSLVWGPGFSFSALSSRLSPRGRRRLGCWQKLPEPSPGPCWGLGSGRGLRGLSQWVPGRSPLSAAGGRPGGCGCGCRGPCPGLGDGCSWDRLE